MVLTLKNFGHEWQEIFMNNFLGAIIAILNQLNLAIISVFSNAETVSFNSVPIKESVQSGSNLWKSYGTTMKNYFAALSLGTNCFSANHQKGN